MSSGESVGAVFPDPAGPNDSSEVSGAGSPLVIAPARAPSTTDLQDRWSSANWQTTGWSLRKQTKIEDCLGMLSFQLPQLRVYLGGKAGGGASPGSQRTYTYRD